MKSRSQRFVSLVSLFVISVLSTTFGQSNPGAVPIRIPAAPTPECINGSTDQVWLTLYRIITERKNGFFSKETQAEIVLNVQVKTRPQSSQPISYPLSTKVNIGNYSAGQVSIPVEYTLVSGLDLQQPNPSDSKHPILYTGFGVDTTLVNLKSKNGLGSAIQALAEITGSNKLPIPDSPYTQAAGYLLDFANKAITNDISTKNQDDKFATASLSLNFDPAGTCAGPGPGGQGFETTGTKAILMATGTPSDMLIPIDQPQNYCWAADVTPIFMLKAARKEPAKACTDSSYADQYRPITNDYIAYFLQKRTTASHLGGPTQRQKEMLKAKQLCDALYVGNCPAAKP